MLSIPFEKKFFIFTAWQRFGVRYNVRANFKKIVPVLSFQRSSSHLMRRPFLLFQNHLIIILFLSMSIGIFWKIFFIFTLDNRWKADIIEVLFLKICFGYLLWWLKKGRSLWGRPFFISKSVDYTTELLFVNVQNPRKIFYFSTWQNRKTGYNITRIDSLVFGVSFLQRRPRQFWRDLLFFIRQEARTPNSW